ncbi:hypothetical protein T4E_1663 [Trichinella pseudospiralis]|uniref:MULE transposase domain-containing protein n=1 Tax=Trichinella pseudospiralis TaxID=6337 RepID=A0A0V0XXC0_TRIPS|nr:hypothetical protein T4E_1663 [Trichinella pseudospiralis]
MKFGKMFLFSESASKYIRVFLTENNRQSSLYQNGINSFLPLMFLQLVSTVCCFCTCKDIGTYGFILRTLIIKTAALKVDINPLTIICDFETAFLPVILVTI